MTYNKNENITTRPVGRPKGYAMTEEHKQIISEANSGSGSYLFGKTGKDHPLWGDEEKRAAAADKIGKKNSESNRGTKMIKDNEIKKVRYTEIECFLDDGWMFVAKKINMNNGERNKLISPSDYETYLAEGWSWGSLSTYVGK